MPLIHPAPAPAIHFSRPSQTKTCPLPASMIRQMLFRVHRLQRMYALVVQDAHDLQQDLYLHITRAMARHDPARASATTYCRGVMDLWYMSQCKSLRKQADRRARLTGLSSSEAEDAAARRDSGSVEATELRLDVAQAMIRLPANLRPIAEGILSGMTAIEIAADRGIHRASVHRLLRQLQPHFVQLQPESRKTGDKRRARKEG